MLPTGPQGDGSPDVSPGETGGTVLLATHLPWDPVGHVQDRSRRSNRSVRRCSLAAGPEWGAPVTRRPHPVLVGPPGLTP